MELPFHSYPAGSESVEYSSLAEEGFFTSSKVFFWLWPVFNLVTHSSVVQLNCVLHSVDFHLFCICTLKLFCYLDCCNI